MPAVISAYTALRNEFREIVSEAVTLNEELEAVIAVKPSQPSEGFHGKVSHSPAPWNTAAANAILDLHALTRTSETVMLTTLNLPVRSRGGSSANTRKALQEMLHLSYGCDDHVVHQAKRDLDNWCRQASIVLGKTETAKRLPRLFGDKEALCPWCKRDTLRQLALDGTIFCIDPQCKDEEDRRPKAQLEYFRGEMVLRWQDGIIGAP